MIFASEMRKHAIRKSDQTHIFAKKYSKKVRFREGDLEVVLGMLYTEIDAVFYGWRLFFGARFGHAVAGIRGGIP